MRCAETYPQSSINTKILVEGGVIGPDPGVYGDVTFQIYGIYYRQLKQDVLGTLTKTYMIYFVGGLDCDRVSELSYPRAPRGS